MFSAHHIDGLDLPTFKEVDLTQIRNSYKLIEKYFLDRLDALLMSASFDLQIEKISFRATVLVLLEKQLEPVKQQILFLGANVLFDPLVVSIDSEKLETLDKIVQEGIITFLKNKNEIMQRSKKLSQKLIMHLNERFPGFEFTEGYLRQVCRCFGEANYLSRFLNGDVPVDKILWAIEYEQLEEIKNKFKHFSALSQRNIQILAQIESMQQEVLCNKERQLTPDDKLGSKRIFSFYVEEELRLLKLIDRIYIQKAKVLAAEKGARLNKVIADFSRLERIIASGKNLVIVPTKIESDLKFALADLAKSSIQYQSKPNAFAEILPTESNKLRKVGLFKSPSPRVQIVRQPSVEGSPDRDKHLK